MNVPSIAILMATYNGERFVSQQLDSILSQTSSQWHLYLHDDGSTDNTPSILRTYAEKYPRQLTLFSYSPQGGAFRNFMSMLERVDAPYYMFCDQDDVWHTDKIERSVCAMSQAENLHAERRPVIIHTDLRVVDEEGRTLADSFWKEAGMHPDMFHNFAQRITNVVTGCTMLFNQTAKEAALSRTPEGFPLHDEWVTICTCAEGGTVVPLFEQLIDYRQHTANTLGAEACYNRKTLSYYLTSLRTIWHENRDNYRVLRSAGYGSPLRYLVNKMRNMMIYRLKY